MSKVEITIGGREFALACSPQDEERVRSLAATIDAQFEPLGPRFSQNLLFACLRAADSVFEKAGVAPGEDGETRRLRDRLADVERERDRLEAALSGATDARGRLERDLKEARQQTSRNDETQAAEQAARIAALEERNASLIEQLEDARSQELPLGTPPDGGGLADGSAEELLPALERFAGLLESCADKLEGRAATS